MYSNFYSEIIKHFIYLAPSSNSNIAELTPISNTLEEEEERIFLALKHCSVSWISPSGLRLVEC